MALAMAGCATQIRAAVRSDQEPLATAAVSMDCPQVLSGTGESTFGTTDAEGRFVLDEPGAGRWLHDGCDLVVRRDGYVTERYPVTEVCTERWGNRCTRVEIYASLARER